LGPVQLYVAPATDGVDNEIASPVQTGEFDEATGVAGAGVTLMFISAVFTQPFASVPVTVYNVVAAGVAITTFPESVFKPEAGPQV
jgi:hypothetical protein